jgi:hypothetical protein
LSDIRGGIIIKRYELDYVWKWKNPDLSIIEFEEEDRLTGFRLCDDGDWVEYDDIKHLLERSDNSDYATASPKLPSLTDVCNNCERLGIKPKHILQVYTSIKKLGNFS